MELCLSDNLKMLRQKNGYSMETLAFSLLIFAAFNVIFLGGFFKTAYTIGRPFIVFIVVGFVIIGIGMMGVQTAVLVAAAVVYAVVTMISCRNSEKRFEIIDL